MFNIKDNELVLKSHIEPFHCTIYKENQHSYKELPIKYCETSTVFKNDRDIKGITKTKQKRITKLSTFCEIQKVKESIKENVIILKQIIDKLNIDVELVVSTWNTRKKEDYIGTIDEWNVVTDAMKEVLDELKIPYEINQRAKMYGPAIKTIYGDKKFQSIQVDFEISHRFDLKYKSNNNEELFPLYMSTNLIGSFEKLISILIE